MGVAVVIGGEAHAGAVFWGLVVGFMALALALALFPRRKLSDEEAGKLVDELKDRESRNNR